MPNDIEQLVKKVRDEYEKSVGELMLTKQEFQDYFKLNVAMATKIIDELLITGRFKLVPDQLTGTERFQIHPKYKRNYWLKSVLVEEEAEILLDLGAQLDRPFNTDIKQIQIEQQHIVSLKLSNQHLKTIPESLGELSQLRTLDLQNNQLASLPNTIGKLIELITLDLEKNQLTTLPEEIGKLTKLKYLYLKHNNLTTLPSSLTNLGNLKKMTLDKNLIEPPFKNLIGSYQSLFKVSIIGSSYESRDLSSSICSDQNFNLNYTTILGHNVSTCKIISHPRIILDDYQNIKTIEKILDSLSNQDMIDRVRSSFFRNASACIILFNKNDRSSFEDIPNWYMEFRKHTRSPQLPVAIIGISSDSDVSTEEAQTFARQFPNCTYFNCTLMNRNELGVVIEHLLRDFLNLDRQSDFSELLPSIQEENSAKADLRKLIKEIFAWTNFSDPKERFREVINKILRDEESLPTPFIYYSPYPKGPPVASAETIPIIFNVCLHCGEPNPQRKHSCSSCGANLTPPT